MCKFLSSVREKPRLLDGYFSVFLFLLLFQGGMPTWIGDGFQVSFRVENETKLNKVYLLWPDPEEKKIDTQIKSQ